MTPQYDIDGNFRVYQGNNEAIAFTITDNGDPVDLSQSQKHSLTVRRRGSRRTIFLKEDGVGDVDGNVEFVLTPADLSEVGTYEWDYQETSAGGDIITWRQGLITIDARTNTT